MYPAVGLLRTKYIHFKQSVEVLDRSTIIPEVTTDNKGDILKKPIN